jgi:hypothetical protein
MRSYWEIALDSLSARVYRPPAMKTLIPLVLYAAVFTAPNAPSPADMGPTRGKVLILENEQPLVGDIERVGDSYRVRRLIGETTVPADRVLRLCADMDEAFQFVRSRANLADADERLRLAEWCRLNGLHEQAVAEVKAAVQLRPDHVATRRLLSYLEESGPIKQTPAKESGDAANARVSIDLTEEALGQFATKVQPILMNACANCHANGRGGAFKLTHAYNSTVLNRKTLQQNLAAVLGEVNLIQPQNSLLLSKAVSVHGSQEQAPIKNRQAAAYHALEEWVWITLANNPQLRDEAVQKAAAKAPAASPFAEVKTPPGDKPRVAADDGAKPSAPAAKEAPEPADPYSPDDFNRQFHGDKSKSQPKP